MMRELSLGVVVAACTPHGPPLPVIPDPLPLAEAAARQGSLYVCDMQTTPDARIERMTIGDENIGSEETWCAGFHNSDALACFRRDQTDFADVFTTALSTSRITVAANGAATYRDSDTTGPNMTGLCLPGQHA